MQPEQLIESASILSPDSFGDWLNQHQEQLTHQSVEVLKSAAEAINDEGRLPDALILLDRAIQVAQATGDPLNAALAWRGRANVFQMAERFEESLAAASQAASIYRQHGTAFDVAVARTVEVLDLGALERFDEAIELAHEIRIRFEEISFQKGLAFIAANLGKVYTMAWQLDLALREYRRARNLFTKLGLSGFAAEVLHNMGVTAYYLDRLDLARRYYTKSYQDLVDAGDLYTAIKAQFNLAQLCQREGKYEQALEHLNQARDDIERLPDSSDNAYVDLFEGQVRHALGQHEQARALFRQAVAHFDQLGRQLESAQAWMALGQNLAHSSIPDHVQEGLSCLEEAEIRTTGFDVPLLKALMGLYQAECLLTLDRPFEASERAQAARNTFVEAKIGLRLAQTDAVLADSFWRLQPHVARRSYMVALDAATGKDLFIAARCHRGLGRLAAADGNLDEAERYYDQAIQLLDEVRKGLHGHAHQSGFMEDKSALTEELLAALSSQIGNEARVLMWVERLKAQALADLLADRPDDTALDDQLIVLLDARRRLRDQYDLSVQLGLESSNMLVAAGQQRAPAFAVYDARQGRRLSDMTRQMHLLDERIAAYRHPAVAWRSGTSSSLQEIGQLIDQRTALISYYSIQGQLFALVVTNGEHDIRSYPLKISIADLEAQWQRTYRLLTQPDSSLPDLQTRLGRIWHNLIAPMHAQMRDCEHLIIVPHQGLFRVPFSALFDPIAHQYLVERWSVQMAPSATVLNHCRKQSQGSKAPLLVGYPGRPEEVDYLPGVVEEINLLNDIVQRAEVISGEDATPHQVMTAASGRPLIHLACHATYDKQDPLMSGLRLAGGRWLRAADLYQNYGVFEGSTVVLSGCNTSQGRPTGQDVLGLVSALIYAGAACVVAGLWRVDDLATVNLMQALYGEIIHTRSVSEAMQRVQLSLMHSSDYEHPYYWAPFVPTGDASRSKLLARA